MNREEAITTLKNYIERITGGMFPGEREILVEAFDALRSPWVKTADRLPTKEDADDEGKVTALITGMLTGKLLSLSLYYASVTAESADYFLPMPKFPRVEE